MEGTIFVAPWIIGFLIFMAYPLCYSLYISFHNVRFMGSGIAYDFVGLKYYKTILFEHGGILYNSLLPFLQQILIMIPIIVIFSLLIAIMLNQKFPGRTLFRIIFFLPVIFATGEVVQEFITQGEGELGFLERYDVESMVRLYLPEVWATPIIRILNSFILILWYSGVQILIFLAGRQTISNSVYEAARIDGSSPWETFWKITLPGMAPFIILNLIYTVVDLFTFPSNPVITQIKENNTQYGMSSAVAWIYFAIIFIFLLIVFAIFARMTKAAKVQY